MGEELSRRSTIEAVYGGLLGLFAYSRRPNWPGYVGGYIEATPLDDRVEPLPDEYITPHDDDRIADVKPLQEALRRPRERIEVSRREFADAFTALEELPVFHRLEHEGYDHVPPGNAIYVRDSADTHHVRLEPYCNDGLIGASGAPTGDDTCYRSPVDFDR